MKDALTSLFNLCYFEEKRYLAHAAFEVVQQLEDDISTVSDRVVLETFAYWLAPTDDNPQTYLDLLSQKTQDAIVKELRDIVDYCLANKLTFDEFTQELVRVGITDSR